MTWQDKFVFGVEAVLNEGRNRAELYKVKIDDEKTYSVWLNGVKLFYSEYLHPLCNHWKSAIPEAVNLVIKERIRKILIDL